MTGFKEHVISVSGLSHALSKHGEDGARKGEIPVTKEHFAMIPDVIGAYETLDLRERDGDLAEDLRYRK